MGCHTYLVQRKGSANWYFKGKVPRDLMAAFGREQAWKSLRTADLAEAKRRGRDAADAFDKPCRPLRDRASPDAMFREASIERFDATERELRAAPVA